MYIKKMGLALYYQPLVAPLFQGGVAFCYTISDPLLYLRLHPKDAEADAYPNGKPPLSFQAINMAQAETNEVTDCLLRK
jgi:hypothetical protein